MDFVDVVSLVNFKLQTWRKILRAIYIGLWIFVLLPVAFTHENSLKQDVMVAALLMIIPTIIYLLLLVLLKRSTSN